MTILLAVCGFFLVSFALGFGLGWWVRGAYPPRVPANVTIEEQVAGDPVEVLDTRLVVVGTAERGFAEPVRIRSFDEYVQHFGQPEEAEEIEEPPGNVARAAGVVWPLPSEAGERKEDP